MVRLLGIVCASVTSAFAQTPSESVHFYYGTVKYSSPDGSTPYGSSVSLIKRTISPQNSTIVEVVLQPARKAGDQPVEFVTTLARKDTSPTFDTTDAGHTFTGTITFRGEEWKWTSWDYAVELTSGGKIVGQGTLSESGIQTHKLMSDVSGKLTVRIEEDLPAITSDKYDELRKQMLAN